MGVLIFGRKRVSKRLYYLSAWLVAIGAHLSALWILIANSWQQTPDGYKIVNGRAELSDVWAALINYSTVPRVLHTVLAAWLAGRLRRHVHQRLLHPQGAPPAVRPPLPCRRRSSWG